MKRFIGFLLVVFLLTSCGEYHQLLKSDDYNLVYNKAVEYYNKGEYQKAMNLFEGVKSVFTLTSKAPNMAYYRAFCAYNLKDYELASHLFKAFVSLYPEQSYAEECLYMIGYCNYMSSPNPRLDQKSTEDAINDFQLYLNRYPMSGRKEKINQYIDELKDKLAYKAYLSSRNYYLRAHYKAAVISLQNCLKDYPGSKHREEVMYMLFNSKYEMAVNSVDDKKLERYNAAKEEYYYFADEYPASKFMKDMQKKYADINAYIGRYNFDEQ